MRRGRKSFFANCASCSRSTELTSAWSCFKKVESSLLIEEEPHAASETLYTRVPRRGGAPCRDERALAAAGCGGPRDRLVHPAALDGPPPRPAPRGSSAPAPGGRGGGVEAAA